MGEVLSKCCGKTEKKYVGQPEQEEDDVNVVMNNGGTIKNNKGSSTSNSSKTETSDRTEKQNGSQKQTKKRRGKYSSSESDSSSDSDYEEHKRKSKYGNGKVYINKKTVIGGNKITIGGNVRVVNIGRNSSQSKNSERKNKNEESKRKEEDRPLFSSGFDAESARKEEDRMWQSVEAAGCFINLRGSDMVEFVNDANIRNRHSDRVGFLSSDRFQGAAATCFRVGENYIMTALHVISQYLDKVYDTVRQPIPPSQLMTQTSGAQPDNDASFNECLKALKEMYVVFDYLTPESLTPEKKFYLKRIDTLADIPFRDGETDCIVLEIQQASGAEMPPPFQVFSYPPLEKGFWFLSHPDGKHMCTEKVSIILKPDAEQTQRDIQLAKQTSDDLLVSCTKDKSVYKFQSGDFNTPENLKRLLFHTGLAHGASGSPGVVVRGDGVVAVVTMLLRGFPDWFYCEGCSDIKQYWDPAYCVEQGANMTCIYNKMKISNPVLCENIFPAHVLE